MSTDAQIPPDTDAQAVDPSTSALPEQAERPLVDAALWRSVEGEHYGNQFHRWEASWRRMSERERARALEFIELDILWENSTAVERDKAVKAVQEDREWPNRYEKLEAEERERREQAEKEKRQRAAEAKRGMDKLARGIEEVGEQIEADIAARHEREEREAQEAEEAQERSAEEERKRLQVERDQLIGAS